MYCYSPSKWQIFQADEWNILSLLCSLCHGNLLNYCHPLSPHIHLQMLQMKKKRGTSEFSEGGFPPPFTMGFSAKGLVFSITSLLPHDSTPSLLPPLNTHF